MAPKSKSNPAKRAATKIESTKAAVPNWPAIAPVLSSQDLVIDEVLSDQIVVIRNLFTSNLCKTLVAFFSTLPLATTPGVPKRGEALRVNDRFQISDPVFAEQLWRQTALHDLLVNYHDQSMFGGEILGLNPNIRIYRYGPGQFFDQHYDESVKLSFQQPHGESGEIPAKTTWTLLIYLTTCEGGETIFYPEAKSKRQQTPAPIVCGLEAGLALLHRHGDECMLHEGSEVKKGEKWVLRSDLVVKR